MTEAWKSNPHYYCEICKVWMNDNPSARATHEKGVKHQDNLARKLRDMRHKADADKREEALAAATMSSIEARAQKQYAADLKAQSTAREDLTGAWEKDDESGHFYNARHRYYYDGATRMYYGGEPPAWTLTPSIPPEALYRETTATQPPLATGAGAAGKKYSSIRPTTKAKNAHPLANIGGYQMPMVGKIGGNSGQVGKQSDPKTANGATKRIREEPGGAKQTSGKKAISKEEEEALKRREAARARVQQRTMNAFGLQ